MRGVEWAVVLLVSYMIGLRAKVLMRCDMSRFRLLRSGLKFLALETRG
jgi:hypothetical protein